MTKVELTDEEKEKLQKAKKKVRAKFEFPLAPLNLAKKEKIEIPIEKLKLAKKDEEGDKKKEGEIS